MKSKINTKSPRQSANRFLFYGTLSYLLITLVAFSGVLSEAIDGASAKDEGFGIALMIFIFGFPLLIPAILFGKSHGLYLNKPFATHSSLNVLFVVVYYIWLMVTHFLLGLLAWRLS